MSSLASDLPSGFSAEQVERLRSHAEKATRTARWALDSHAHLEPGCRCLSCYLRPSTFGVNVMIFCDEQSTGDSECENQGFKYEDAEYLVEAQPENILALLDHLAKVEQELARTQEALRQATNP